MGDGLKLSITPPHVCSYHKYHIWMLSQLHCRGSHAVSHADVGLLEAESTVAAGEFVTGAGADAAEEIQIYQDQ